MSRKAELDDQGKLNVGPVSGVKSGAINVAFTSNDTAGIALNVEATPAAGSEKAAIKLGDYTIGQDTLVTGVRDYSVLDSNGVPVFPRMNGAGIGRRVLALYRSRALGLKDEDGTIQTCPAAGGGGFNLNLYPQASDDVGSGIYDPNGWLLANPSAASVAYFNSATLTEAMEHRTFKIPPGFYFTTIIVTWSRLPAEAAFYFQSALTQVSDWALSNGPVNALVNTITGVGEGYTGTLAPSSYAVNGFATFMNDGEVDAECALVCGASGGTGADLFIQNVQLTVTRIM